MTLEQERELREWAVQSHDERAGFLALAALNEIVRLRGMISANTVCYPTLAEFYAGQPEVLK